MSRRCMLSVVEKTHLFSVIKLMSVGTTFLVTGGKMKWNSLIRFELTEKESHNYWLMRERNY